MSLPPNQDRLVSFLRQYRPVAPPANEELEESILQAVKPQPLAQIPWKWPVAIAASLLLALTVSHRLQTLRETEQKQLEAFIENSWDGTVNSAFSDAAPTEDFWLF